MLTKDVALSVCILDLIDNSIQGLISDSKIDVSEHLISGTKTRKIDGRIDISFGPDKFEITDDCGGVSIADATNQIFLFGNPADGDQAGLGVYGIGMKRAFFKIGKAISFRSHTRKEELAINIDVDDWKKKREWNFPFIYARPKLSASGGTTIEITDLHPVISEQFGSKAFRSILIDRISRAYALFLKAGLKIRVNKDTTIPDFPELAASKDIKPVRKLLKTKNEVEILILVGISPRSDKKPRGWYVFCNGRMVLDADKTDRTGWGIDSHPTFQPKYNHFLGYAYFRSSNVHKLPWTTTKDGIDRESVVYQTAIDEMWVLCRPVLDFLNDLYPGIPEESEPEHALFLGAKAITPQEIAKRPNSIFEVRVKKRSDDDLVSIQYKRPNRKLKKIKESLGRSISASGIGEYTFDWYYDRNCK